MTKTLKGSIVGLLVSGLLIGCSSNTPATADLKTSQGDFNQNASEKSLEINGRDQDRKPKIEIWQELDGSVHIRGKSLYFRMFDGGLVEFDYLLRKESGQPKRPHTFSIERTPLNKISEGSLTKINSLISDLIKSKEIKQEYKGIAITLDVETRLTVILKVDEATGRQLIINDADYDIASSKYEKKFPQLISSLIKEIRSQREEFAPESYP